MSFRPRAIPGVIAQVNWRAGAAVAAAGFVGATLVAPAALADPKQGSTGKAPATAPTVPTRKPATPTTAKRTTNTTAKSSSSGSKSSSSSSKSTASASKGFGMGSRGDAVLKLQTRLQELHYDITELDGQFGGQAYHAVMAFQKVNGLARSGRATPQTLTALESATDPTPLVPDGGEDRVEIDLTKQTLAIYKGGTVFKLLSISSGTGKPFCALDPETGKQSCDVAVTPPGSFRVTNRIIGWRESRLGLLYNPLYFNGGIAMHGSSSVPATPASHGCVRVPMVSAEWLPDEITDGTPVYVYGGDRLPTPLKPKASTTTSTAVTTTTGLANPLTSTTALAGTPTTVAGTPTTLPPAPTTTVAGAATTIPATTTTTSTARLLTTTTLAPPPTTAVQAIGATTTTKPI